MNVAVFRFPVSLVTLPDPPRHRLFVDAALAAGEPVALAREQSNYLLNVLRLRAAAPVLLFNGRDGEWLAELAPSGRRDAALIPRELIRAQPPASDLHYLFAPLKQARLDYLAQKAVEMGAGVLQPVITRRTQVARPNLDRIAANAREAAEQCGILALPEIRQEEPLERTLAGLEPGRTLVFCDEEAPAGDALAPLLAARGRPAAVLIGPEGGFDAAERGLILAVPGVVRLSLGPRILRADTAAVAALALVQATLGDWTRGG